MYGIVFGDRTHAHSHIGLQKVEWFNLLPKSHDHGVGWALTIYTRGKLWLYEISEKKQCVFGIYSLNLVLVSMSTLNIRPLYVIWMADWKPPDRYMCFCYIYLRQYSYASKHCSLNMGLDTLHLNPSQHILLTSIISGRTTSNIVVYINHIGMFPQWSFRWNYSFIVR